MSSSRIKLPDVVFVFARSEPGGVIGAGNGIPWHLRTDLKRFKAITLGHAVIMGRRTFASLGRPLPQRLNVVLSRGGLGMGSPNLIVARSGEAALTAAENYALGQKQSEIFVIGGAEVFALYEPLCRRVHLTEVLSPGIEGDTYFKATFDPREWQTMEEMRTEASAEDQYPARYLLLERRSAKDRFRDKSETPLRAV
jgi:dihydrofolate reductase